MKREKQEVRNNTFDLSNISKAKSKSKFQEKKTKTETIKFKVKGFILKHFYELKLDYAKENKIYSLSNNKVFSNMIIFLNENYKRKGILKNCPKSFKEAIVRPGKRKTTERTSTFEDNEIILFKIESGVADMYMNIMYSFIKNDNNQSEFDDHHTRTYFFYDFINEIKTNKEKFLNS